MVAALAGGAAGPLVTGGLHDLTGNYTLAFAIAIGMSGLSALAIWRASPRKVRSVAGRLPMAGSRRSRFLRTARLAASDLWHWWSGLDIRCPPSAHFPKFVLQPQRALSRTSESHELLILILVPLYYLKFLN